MTASSEGSKKSSRRKRRGHAGPSTPAGTAPAVTTATDAPPRKRGKVDPRTYAQVMERIKAFVEARLVKLVTPVARGFFNGCTQEEIQRPDLQSAFFLFFVLGYRDPNGVRILDMYRGYGFKPTPVEARVVDALDVTRLRLVEVVRKVEANRQLEVRDVFDDTTFKLSDQEAYKSLDAGDGMMAWFMPSSEIHRPIEVATHVGRELLGPMVDGLRTLASEAEVSPEELGRRKPAQMFWAVYRGVQRFSKA